MQRVGPQRKAGHEQGRDEGGWKGRVGSGRISSEERISGGPAVEEGQELTVCRKRSRSGSSEAAQTDPEDEYSATEEVGRRTPK